MIRGWLAALTALGLVAALGSPVHADNKAPTLFCVFPQSTPLPECFKGNSISERAVRDCEERNKHRKKVPPRVRIDHGAWVEFAPDRWRCVSAPATKMFKFQIENHNKVFYSDRMTMPDTCATGRVDLIRPTFYGSMWAKCSKRKKVDGDDVVASP